MTEGTENNGTLPSPPPVFKSKFTFYMAFCWIIAAFGGLMFGYDIGISGGVTSMDDFLISFFPEVYEKKLHAKENNYCKYDSQSLQLFTSSLYLAALVASFIGSKVCNSAGRKWTIRWASLLFMAGAASTAGGFNLMMLICGRILFGFGVGFGNEAVPVFLSEVAPPQHRGAVNILFQLFVTIGILLANMVNFVTSNMHPWGWRLSLGLAAVPAFFLFLGSFYITETPTSLIERKKYDKGKKVLERIRGVNDVDAEFEQLVNASEIAAQVKHPFKNLMKSSSRPPLIIAILLQVFQQFTGINAIMFYAPVLFQTVGFGNDAALLSSIITGLVNVISTIVSIFIVDKVGRRVLLIEACFQMLLTMGIVGGILHTNLLTYSSTLGHEESIIVVLLLCVFVMGFAWSWGPLGWLIPSETFPMETRTAGFAFAVSSNMLFTFLIAQSFLSMLCYMQALIFFFFAGWIVVMGLFAILLIPETKGIPVDLMVERVWKKHWFWKKYMIDDEQRDAEEGI